jgi:GNAT superfamily N-acetyltransferase
MAASSNGARPAARQGELYYLHVPAVPRPVRQRVEFLTTAEFLEDEAACKALWRLLDEQFRTRSKFLAIWPCVRFVAVHRRGGELAGALLVSALVNWQLDYVVVRPDCRGQGVAAALVGEALNQALARQVPYVMLTSHPGLRPLYEAACGFTVVGGRGQAGETPAPALPCGAAVPVTQP